MSYLILTLTINPAIDRNVTADRLVFEDRGYILATDEMAGGRGINASRVIHSFGGKTRAIVTSGGSSGARLEALVKAYGFPVEVAPIRNEIRTNLTITDKHGNQVVDTTTAGPWFYIELPDGKYDVRASYDNQTEEIKNLEVSKNHLTTRLLHWELAGQKASQG